MKTLLLMTAVVLALASGASAGNSVTCTKLGSYTYCN
jgi:hypothetical protein